MATKLKAKGTGCTYGVVDYPADKNGMVIVPDKAVYALVHMHGFIFVSHIPDSEPEQEVVSTQEEVDENQELSPEERQKELADVQWKASGNKRRGKRG